MKRVFQRMIITLIDWSAIVYTHILWSSLFSFFFFVPFYPGIVITSLSYYLFFICKYRKTLGMYIIPSEYRFHRTWLMIARELAFSGSTLVLLSYLFFTLPYSYSRVILPGSILVILFILIPWLNRKVFKFSFCFLTGTDRPATVRKGTYYYALLFAGALVVRCVFYFGIDNSFGHMYISPRVTDKYVSFLKEHRQPTLDYVFDLYKKYDHVILCERLHPEYTQWDLIYQIVSDPRYSDLGINLFTEYGAMNTQEDFSSLLASDYANDSVLDKELGRFLQNNTSIWPIWTNSNWHDFLKKFYYLHKERNLKLWFTDGPFYWDQLNTPVEYQEMLSLNRDSLMASSIIKCIHKDSISKSLIIMNTRHALMIPPNCGSYLAEKYGDKVTNLLLNATSSKFMLPFALIQNGVWDQSFAQLADSTYAFTFEESPFGEDGFDYYPWLSLVRKYKEMFHGFIFYRPIDQQVKAIGYPYMLDDFDVELKRRAALLENYEIPSNEQYVEPLFYLPGGVVKDLIFVSCSIFSILFLSIRLIRNILRRFLSL